MAAGMSGRARYTLIGLAMLVLSGCGNGLAERRAALAPFIGRGEADLVRALGVPVQTYDAGGHRFLAYIQTQTAVIPGSYGPPPWGVWGPGSAWGWGASPPQVVQSVCETVFELADTRVVGFSVHGSGC